MISATFKHIVSSFLMLVEILGLKFPFLFGAKYLTTGLVCYLQLFITGSAYITNKNFEEKKTWKLYRYIAKSKILPALHKEFHSLDAR